MLAFENISVEKKDSLACLTVNRPTVLNALNKATLAEIAAALEDIRDDAGIAGLIVTGAGGYWLNPAVVVRFASEPESPCPSAL